MIRRLFNSFRLRNQPLSDDSSISPWKILLLNSSFPSLYSSFPTSPNSAPAWMNLSSLLGNISQTTKSGGLLFIVFKPSSRPLILKQLSNQSWKGSMKLKDAENGNLTPSKINGVEALRSPCLRTYAPLNCRFISFVSLVL